MRKMSRLSILMMIGMILVYFTAVSAKESPPKPEKIKKLSFPSFKEFRSNNGIEAVVVEHHEQPIVTISVVVKSGATVDPEGLEALSDFVANNLNKGTKDKDSNQLAKWIESVGGAVSIDAGNDFTTIYITILSDFIETAYEYLQDILFNPTFPDDEIEEYRKRFKTALELELSQPSSVASRHFDELIYGEHPYSRYPTVESVEAITREDMVNFYNTHYLSSNALIAVVGDVKWKDVRKSINKYFGDWSGGNGPKVDYPEPPTITADRIFLYHKPGAVQTNILVGHPGLKPTNPDWPAVTTANRILGGGSDARLFMNLREEKGWTYGAYSGFSKPKDIGRFRARVEVRTEVTDSALVELLSELKRITGEPVTEDELKNAKSYLVGNFPITIETPEQIAGQVVRVKLLGLGKKYLEQYRSRIDAVTIDDVSRVMKTYLHPDNSVIVLVGDATAIYDKVKDIAPVELFDLEGKSINMASLMVKPVHYDYDTSVLKDMTATYSLTMRTMPLGDMVVEVKRKKSGDQEIFQVSNSVKGMLMLDEKMEFSAVDLAPISYKSEMVAGPNKMNSELAVLQGKISGTVQGMGEKEPKKIEKELVEGTIFGEQIDFALAILPLEPEKSFSFPIIDSRSGDLINAVAEIMSEERVKVAAGDFDTYKIKVKRSEGVAYYYSMKELPHLLVKQDIPAQGMSIELKAISK